MDELWAVNIVHRRTMLAQGIFETKPQAAAMAEEFRGAKETRVHMWNLMHVPKMNESNAGEK